MTIVRWNPSRDLDILERQINRLFNDPFLTTSWKELGNLTHAPAAEINEDDEAVYLKLEVPGMEAKDIDLNVTNNAVSISGERKSESESPNLSEFSYGKFQRVINLPAKIENTEVTAEYKNGILHLTLPKAEAEKNKVVKVDVQAS